MKGRNAVICFVLYRGQLRVSHFLRRRTLCIAATILMKVPAWKQPFGLVARVHGAGLGA